MWVGVGGGVDLGPGLAGSVVTAAVNAVDNDGDDDCDAALALALSPLANVNGVVADVPDDDPTDEDLRTGVEYVITEGEGEEDVEDAATSIFLLTGDDDENIDDGERGH